MPTAHGVDPTLSIPVIDISRSTAQIANDLVEAAASHGFVFIKSQILGFNSQLLEDIFDLVGFWPIPWG